MGHYAEERLVSGYTKPARALYCLKNFAVGECGVEEGHVFTVIVQDYVFDVSLLTLSQEISYVKVGCVGVNRRFRILPNLVCGHVRRQKEPEHVLFYNVGCTNDNCRLVLV